MRINDIQEMLNKQEKMRYQLEKSSYARASLARGNDMVNAIRQAYVSPELLRAASNALKQFHGSLGSGYVDASYTRILRHMDSLTKVVEEQFYLPELTRVQNLLRQFENSSFAVLMERYNVGMSQITRSFETMRTSWLNTVDEMSSVKSLATLKGIGHAIGTTKPFDTKLTDSLRIDLGDLRDRISWPPDVFIDPLARTSLYVERGLNSKLTAFPAKAFDQITADAGLRGIEIPLDDEYNFEAIRDVSDEDEIALERTNEAHDKIQRFETRLRRFIDELMTEAFGPSWTKHQLPGDIRKQWIDKRQKAREYGEREWPLIAYADFSDYVTIITRKDNWTRVFQGYFGRKTSVQESFQRLYPIRICTMHSRPITQDDEFYLFVETKRLLGAMIGKA